MVRGVHPILRGRLGNILTKAVFSIGGLNKANAVYDGSKHLTGVDFTNDLLDKLGITRKFENYKVFDSFKEGPFIVVSNHPYGHIDGITAISAVGGVRRDYKMMVNWVLMQIDTMEDFFLGVNPFPKDSRMSQVKSSFEGIKQCLSHLQAGHPLGFFPAGGVSQPHLLTKTEDRDWQPSVLKLIKKAQVPVIPMYISGNNSWFYRFLGLIDWRIRTIRLCHELTNKRGKTIYVRFGKPVTVEEQNQYKNIFAFGKFLKDRTYALE